MVYSTILVQFYWSALPVHSLATVSTSSFLSPCLLGFSLFMVPNACDLSSILIALNSIHTIKCTLITVDDELLLDERIKCTLAFPVFTAPYLFQSPHGNYHNPVIYK